MPNIFDRVAPQQLCIGTVTTQTKTGLALGSVYSYGVSGAAVAVRFIAPVSGNLTDVYFFVTATAGTPGVTTVQLRNWNTVNNERPGTTLHASQTITPGTTANRWINAHFDTPFSVVQGSVYWIVIGDAGWTTGNTATVDYLARVGRNIAVNQFFDAYITADGFATNGTDQGYAPAIVLKFADNSLMGCPYTTSAAYASSTLERGIRIAGLTEDLVIDGVIFNGGTVNISGLKIYSGATAPGGTPDLTVTFGAGEALKSSAYFAPFTLRKNTIYRVVLTYGAASAAPSYFEIEDDTASADLTNCGFGGGTMYDTIDNGAGGWTDGIDRFPTMGIIVQDQISIARAAHPFQGVFA